jgi:hypothetical protein
LDGDPTATQTLVVDSKCNVSLSGDQLITITSTGGNGVGAVSHGLGVKTKNNCSTDQGLIAGGQSLTISLGSFFSDSVSIIKAEVDVEGKRSAKLGVKYLPGNETDTIPLTNTSDNGPDSGTGDNNPATLDPRTEFNNLDYRFRAVEFYPVAGGTTDPAVAIEGGGDGEGPRESLRLGLLTYASVFELEGQYDGFFACGDTKSESDGDVTGTFTRLGVEGTDDDCSEIKPYNLIVETDASGGTITFRPEGTVTARYDGTVTFEPYPAANPVPQTLRYDPETDALGFRDMQWCTAVSFVDGVISAATFPAATTADPEPSWCIVSSETSVFGTSGEIQTTWRAYGEGDPRMSGG